MNSRHPPWQGGALPTELQPHISVFNLNHSVGVFRSVVLTGKYYTGFLSVCQILRRSPRVPRNSGLKQGILTHFRRGSTKFIFMVPVTFMHFEAGAVLPLTNTRCGTLAENSVTSKDFCGARKRGEEPILIPRPSPMKTAATKISGWFF